MRRFEGRVALVTGAAQGIGRQIATAFGSEKASVVVVDRDKAALDTCLLELPDAGLDLIAIEADVSYPDQARASVARTIEQYGRLDVLVNNAGGSAFTPMNVDDVTEEDFNRVVDWNLKSTFFMTQSSLPFFRRQGRGVVVNISAISGRAGTELLSPQYSAVKAGVIGLTRNLARHLGPENIRVNAVAPGFTRSGPRVEAIWQSREDPEVVLGMIPLRRRGTMSEVAAAVLFLASDESSYMTGAVLDVNGGFFCV